MTDKTGEAEKSEAYICGAFIQAFPTHGNKEKLGELDLSCLKS